MALIRGIKRVGQWEENVFNTKMEKIYDEV